MATLSDLQLKRLVPPETDRLELTDDKAVGHKFRLTPNGRATWSVQVNVHSEKRRFTIGEYPATGLSEARRQAAKMRADALAGHDPIRDRRTKAEGVMAQQSVAQVLNLYAGLRLKQLKTAGERERQLHRALASHLSKPIGGL
ncbi:MAG TPA: Arm DNA-binding domain-containing protein [Thermohalobaculum sp.]|nr:Arm DNA-binding domain-containing protein [Thermohalobaculum sp.]